MSKSLNRRAAARAFAEGAEHIRTACALSFEGDVAFSYAEPIAVRVGNALYVTTAKFSVTTSHHRGQVAGGWAVYHQVGNPGSTGEIHDVDHGEIRRMARERGHSLAYATHGRRYDRVAA